MFNLDKIRKDIKQRFVMLLVFMVLPIILILGLQIWEVQDLIESQTQPIYDLFVFRYILLGLLEAYIIVNIYKCWRIMKNDEYAENYLIRKRDERNTFITLMSYKKTAQLLCIFLLMIMIGTAFSSREIFYTCFGIVLLQVLTFIIVKAVYNKKY
jgi:hypothetical protein